MTVEEHKELSEVELEHRLKAFLTPPKPPNLEGLLSIIKSSDENIKQISEIVGKSAELANNISAKVRQLDAEQVTLKKAIKQVEDAELIKECIKGVEKNMEDREYTKAAEWIEKFLAFGEDNLKSLFDNNLIGTSSGSQSETKLLFQQATDLITKARETLADVASKEFDKCCEAKNENGAFEYVKLFERIDYVSAGLDKVVLYATREIRKRNELPLNIGENGGIAFVDSVTRLFEFIAALVDGMEKRIAEIFNQGSVLYFIRAMEAEAGLQFLKTMDVFGEKRAFTRLLRDIQNPLLKPEEKAEVKKLSVLLDEVTLISQKVFIFYRFMTVRAESELELLSSNEQMKSKLYSNAETEKKYSPTSGLLRSSEMVSRTREMLSLYYIPLESYFMSQNVKKALRIDTYNMKTDELTSSSVEDVFYIFKKVTFRALASQDIDSICVILNILSTSIEDDYLREGLEKRMITGFGGERAQMLTERPDVKIGFMILLNNLDQSCEYVDRLCTEFEAETSKLLALPAFPNASQSGEKVKSCLLPLQQLVEKFKSAVKRGLGILYIQTLKSRFKQAVVDTLSLFTFSMTEEDYNEASSAPDSVSFGSGGKERFVRKFTSNVTKLLSDGYQTYLSENNLTALLEIMVDCFVREWETHILTSQTRINIYAALKFDKDFRAISSFLNNQLPMGSFRDRFLRLGNMVELLNLERLEEFNDFEMSQWRLTNQEIRKILSLKFGNDEISRLKI